MAGKHFLIYYHRGAGTFVVTEPRPSARENQYSFWQIFIAFISLIIPTIFLSALKNNVAFFFLLTFTILLVYLSYKYGFTDVWVGLALAFTLGFPIHYYKVRHTKVD
jgi:hypothetical protein